LTSQFRRAIHGALKFFEFLRPDIIFHEHKGYPKSGDFSRLINNSTQNLKISRTYFGAIVHTCALIEAISDLSGGEAPLSLFVGDMAEVGVRCSQSSYVYPELQVKDTHEKVVYNLLQKGGELKGQCLFSALPAAAYVHASLGHKFVADLSTKCQLYFDHKINARELLSYHSQEFLSDFITHLSKMAITRKDEMHLILSKLKPKAA
jgi:hypothetical protein